MQSANIPTLENMSGYIWHDGKFINWTDAKVHILTHSLHYAGGVFEGEKSYNGKIFMIEKHTERLFQSAKLMNLDIKFSKQEIIDASHELLIKNNIKNAYVRPFVYRSTDALMIKTQNPVIHVMIAAWEPRKIVRSNPLKLIQSRWIKHTNDMHPVQCKASAQYSMFSIAIQEAVDQGYDDALMLDIDGYIAECSASNIFFIKDNGLYTPLTRNCLNGITRQTIIEIAKQNNVKVLEQDIYPDDLGQFESCFQTGTAAGLKEIDSIQTQNSLYNFRENQLFNMLKEQYYKLASGL